MDKKELAKELLDAFASQCLRVEDKVCPLIGIGDDSCPFKGKLCHEVTLDDWRKLLQDCFSAPAIDGEPIHHPAHYTSFPVKVINITAPLGFCLGNAVKYTLRAPFKGGVEDCEKAKVYLQWENQRPVAATVNQRWFRDVQIMLDYLLMEQGEVARAQSLFMLALRGYLLRPSSHFCNLMLKAVDDLQAALAKSGEA